MPSRSWSAATGYASRTRSVHPYTASICGLKQQDMLWEPASLLVRWLFSAYSAVECISLLQQVRPGDGIRGGPGPRARCSKEHQGPAAQPGHRPDCGVDMLTDNSDALLHLGRLRPLSQEASQESQRCLSGDARNAASISSSLGLQPKQLKQKRIASRCDRSFHRSRCLRLYRDCAACSDHLCQCGVEPAAPAVRVAHPVLEVL